MILFRKGLGTRATSGIQPSESILGLKALHEGFGVSGLGFRSL